MLYIINKKPFVKVSNYYKLVKITKKGNEYNVVPEQGENTSIEKLDKNYLVMSVEEYDKKYLKSKNHIDLETNDFE